MTSPSGLPAGAQAVWAWLHLSDIHVGHGNAAWQADQELVLSRLVADVQRLLADSVVPRPNAILVTGDVAFSGAALDATEYARSGAWLAKCRDAVGSVPVFSVPGNHDVRRVPPGDAALWRLIRDTRECGYPEDALDERLADRADATALAGRFAAYEEFAAQYGNPPTDEYGAWTHRVDTGVNEITIRLVGWNTALLSNDDEDRGRLRVAKRALVRTLAGAPARDEVVVVLTHHPIDYLAQDNADSANTELLVGADLHLHGHLHDARSEQRHRGDGGGLVTITAGAVHGDGETELSRHGYSFGAIYCLPDGGFGVAVWPRVWTAGNAYRANSSVVPDGEISAWHPLIRPNVPAAILTRAVAGEAELAARLIRSLGLRRTAYPTDMNISELRERDLLVESALPGYDVGQRAMDRPQVVAALEKSDSVLVLGAPGSGKTVLAYSVAATLLEGDKRVPLPVDASTAFANPPASRTELLRSLAATVEDTSWSLTSGGRALILIVDGVDEALAAGAEHTQISHYLNALSRIGALLVTCRVDDYERNRAAIPTDLFNAVVTMPEWSADGEFQDFANRLEREGLLGDQDLPNRVLRSPELQRLVRRPLFARMLTYIATVDAVIPDQTALYQLYISKAASTTDYGLARVGCAPRVTAARIWRDAAWYVFADRHGRDPLPLADLVGHLREQHGMDVNCAYRALAGIIDAIPGGDGRTAAFLHYSFYEFLVAQHSAERLLSAYPDKPQQAAGALDRDLPAEVRRHLVRILRAELPELHAWPGWLADVYREAQDQPDTKRRTIANLVAYIMPRLGSGADGPLRSLLDEETDPFLRNSLGWALARCDHRVSLQGYLEDLAADEELASLNRGYLLYYFGDLRLHAAPPYRDDSPHQPWLQTRARLKAKFIDTSEHATVPVARQALDIYTWFDLLRVRGEYLNDEEEAAAVDAVSRLVEAGLPAETSAAVSALHAAVKPR